GARAAARRREPPAGRRRGRRPGAADARRRETGVRVRRAPHRPRYGVPERPRSHTRIPPSGDHSQGGPAVARGPRRVAPVSRRWHPRAEEAEAPQVIRHTAGRWPMDTRPMRADARRNYERLIETARTAFAEHGTDASLDDIAKRAGVGSGTLYRHFPTRDALLHAVLRDRIDGLLAHADELLSEPAHDPEDEARCAEAALDRWLRTYLAGAATPRGTSTVIIQAMSPDWAGTGLGEAAAAIRDALGRL